MIKNRMLRRYIVALFLLLGCLTHAPSATGTSIEPDPLQHDLQRILRQENLAGAVFATVMPEGTRVHGIGYFDATTRKPMPPDAKVHVGSIVKTVLAVSLLHLVSQGRVGLDDEVQAWLPAIRFANPWEKTAKVRIRHLLDHTAGLQDVRLHHIFSAKHTPHQPLAQAFSSDASVLQLRSEPGKQYSYSNLGYTLAAMVIEVLVKERYETWADREVLRKIGMPDTSFGFVTQTGKDADPRLAWGHLENGKPVAAQAVAVRPAMQLTTTAADMAQLARFLMSNGQVDGKPFIRPDLLQAMGRASTTVAAQAGLPVGYGLGLANRDRYGVAALCHGGSTHGYRAILCVFPQQQRAFFISYNTDSDTARHDRLEARLIQALGLGPPVAAPPVAAPPPKAAAHLPLSPEWSGRYVPAPSRFELAKLADIVGSSVYLDANPQQASLTWAWGKTILVERVGPHLLQRADRSMASHALWRDEQGQRFLIDHNGTLRRIHPFWHAAIWLSIGLGMAGLLFWLLALPIRYRRFGQQLRQPASWAVPLLLLPVALFALQDWAVLGDFTLASATLYLATLALPCLMILQLVWIARQPNRPRYWQYDGVAALLVLQFCALLLGHDGLPLALWR